MTEPYLKIVGITKTFPGVQALQNVSLEAYAGEVLGIVGANGAGKSTLMNVLGGIFQPESGEILINGKPGHFTSPHDAVQLGIAFVHQEMAMLPTMSVVDNMFISGFPTRGGIIDYRSTEDACRRALQRLGCTFDPWTRIRDLSPGDQQMVEIARAILSEPKIIIFDEPTSSLTSREKTRLFGVIDILKRGGTTILYISHFLDEVFALCDRAVVLRNGQTVGGNLITELTYQDVVEMIIGKRSANAIERLQNTERGMPLLEIEGLSRRGFLQDISFQIHEREVVGLWGLLGSGRTELARAVVGLDHIDAGIIRLNVNGKLRTIQPWEAKNWIGMITENRREEGLLLPMSVRTNMSLANLPNLVSRVWPFIDARRETKVCQDLVTQLEIKVSGVEQPVNTLSGGNQQKVVVSRWLQKKPRIYLMDEPTRGLDVGAKADIRNIISELANQGAAVLVISSEIDEIMSLSDRYLVMNRGQIVVELPATASKNELMAAAAGVLA